MSDGENNVPYDWSQAIKGDKANKKARTDKGSTLKLGVLEVLIALMIGVIVFGGVILAWMSWSFQVEGQKHNADQQGLIPIEKDFAPGQPKPKDVLFRIAGSSALGDKLMPDLVSNWMRARGYSGVGVSEDRRIVQIKGSKDGKSARVLIVKGSAHGGFEGLVQNRVEAVMSARQILPEEADRLSALGNLTNASSEKVIALDASLVLVNRANPMVRIDSETLGRILSGEVTDWSEIVQGGSGKISVKLENLGADTATSPAGRILGDRETPETVDLLDSPQAVADAVSRDTRAIGIARREGGGAKALSVNERNARPVGADDFAISTETYSFSERIYVYVGSSGGDPNARDFADYALSPAGQDIVARTGYTPLNLMAVKVLSPPDAPRDYQSFARDASRMNFDVRFYDGANQPDSRAEEDLKRFVAFIAKQQIDKRRIALLGFADNVGARATNLGLAQSRAETVGIALERLGVSPGVIRAYGDAMPVGANSDERGRIRNRRVEVWICAPPACPLVDLVSQVTTVSREIPSGVRLGPVRKPQEGDPVPKG